MTPCGRTAGSGFSFYEKNDNLICGTHPWEPGRVCCFLIAGGKPRDSGGEAHRGSLAETHHTAWAQAMPSDSSEDVSDLASWPNRRYCLAEVEMAVQGKKGEKSNMIQVIHRYKLMLHLFFSLFSFFNVLFFFFCCCCWF